ncbi:MAG: NUDIX hydrolase [Clostridiales bacterium]|nr:NUDIX hydrolase [Clostridiales bacterium]
METAGLSAYMRKDFSMKDEELIWEEISTEHIVRDEWIDFRRSAYRFPDGKVWQPYYSFTRKDYAVVVASDEADRFICVRQFRQGIRQVTTEFPAGAIEKKDGEDPQAAALRGARRELREETGYVSDCWRPLLVIPSSATISDNYAYLFAAENCRKVTGQELDAMELLRVETHTAEEIDAMLAGGQFQQSVHALAWLLSKGKPAE